MNVQSNVDAFRCNQSSTSCLVKMDSHLNLATKDTFPHTDREWCNRDNRMQTLHNRHASQYNSVRWCAIVYNIARTSSGIMKTSEMMWMCFGLGFINLPFRLSLLAALHTGAVHFAWDSLLSVFLNLIGLYARASIHFSSIFRPNIFILGTLNDNSKLWEI